MSSALARRAEIKRDTWTWSPQQCYALELIDDWITRSSKPFFYLACYAGTGKTTLAAEVARRVGGEIVYAAYTGKAAAVMRAKGCADADTIDARKVPALANTT